MSTQERTGWRPLLYSKWHRVESTQRFLGQVAANRLQQVDIDYCEACEFCGSPLALIETAKSTAATYPKDARITARLAERAGILAFSVIYVPGMPLLDCSECGRQHEDPRDDILRFWVRQIQPRRTHTTAMEPKQYALFLLGLRVLCDCPAQRTHHGAA